MEVNAWRKEKCTVREGKFVDPCTRLELVTEDGNPGEKRKGVYAWGMSNRAGPTRTVFGVKSGKYAENGLLFNVCPFCGERIDTPFLGW